MTKKDNQIRLLSEENRILAKKNMELNESIVGNLNELEGIEKINEEIN